MWIIVSLIFTRVLAHGFVERTDRKRRHLGLGFERRGDQIGVSFLFLRFLLFSVVLLSISTRRCFGSLAREGVSVWEERVVSLLLSRVSLTFG